MGQYLDVVRLRVRHLAALRPGRLPSRTEGGRDERRRAGVGGGRPAPGRAAGDGDVRARRRHVADERVDREGGRGPRHDRQRGAGRHRARGARVGRVHPDREQGRRPHRAQAGLRPRSARLRAGRPGDGVVSGPHGDHRVLGDRRRARRVVAAAGDAVADPRQLPGRGPEEGLRPGGRRGGDRRRGRPADRRLPDHLPVVARRVPAGGRRDRGRAQRPQAHSRRALHRPARRRRGRRAAVGRRHGRRRHRHPRLAGGRGVRRRPDRGRPGRALVARPLARPAQARGQADAARSRPLQARPVPPRHLVADAAEHRARRGDDRAADLPADGARVQRAGDRPDARAAVAHDVRDGARSPASGRANDGPRASSAPDRDC